jgi:hypothetical protein
VKSVVVSAGAVLLTSGAMLTWDSLVGQTPAPGVKRVAPSTATRLPDKRPDIQGVWHFGTLTPLERPAALADKEFLTSEEAAQYVKDRAEQRRKAFAADPIGSYNDEFFEIATEVIGTRRTSLITHPRDGKLPPLTPEAARRKQTFAEMRKRGPSGPEDFWLSDRCIVGINSGPPMVPGPYNNLVQLFQSRDHVVIYNEMNHSARVVSIGNRPPLASAIRRYIGDSRGRWDGDTFVVETTNFPDKAASFGVAFAAGTSSSLRIIERFSRAAADTLMYEFTVDDPLTWTLPWSAALPMKKSDERIYEYACHEGNYAVANILAGARAQEKGVKRPSGKR